MVGSSASSISMTSPSPDRSDDHHEADVHLYQDYVAANEGGVADADDDAGEGNESGMSMLMADDDRDAVGPRPPPLPFRGRFKSSGSPCPKPLIEPYGRRGGERGSRGTRCPSKTAWEIHDTRDQCLPTANLESSCTFIFAVYLRANQHRRQPFYGIIIPLQNITSSVIGISGSKRRKPDQSTLQRQTPSSTVAGQSPLGARTSTLTISGTSSARDIILYIGCNRRQSRLMTARAAFIAKK
jgi:hypothetical protein